MLKDYGNLEIPTLFMSLFATSTVEKFVFRPRQLAVSMYHSRCRASSCPSAWCIPSSARFQTFIQKTGILRECYWGQQHHLRDDVVLGELTLQATRVDDLVRLFRASVSSFCAAELFLVFRHGGYLIRLLFSYGFRLLSPKTQILS